MRIENVLKKCESRVDRKILKIYSFEKVVECFLYKKIYEKQKIFIIQREKKLCKIVLKQKDSAKIKMTLQLKYGVVFRNYNFNTIHTHTYRQDR